MTDVLVITTPAPQAVRVVRRTEGRRMERVHGPRAGRRGTGRRGRTGRARTRVGASGGRGPPTSGRRGRAVSYGCGRRERRRDLEASASVWPG
jgi:hypothetical protein